MQNTRVTHTINEHEKAIAWASAFTHKAQTIKGTALMDPISPGIMQRVSRLYRLPVALLSLTTCRYSELNQIWLADIQDGKMVNVKQPKTGTIRPLMNLEPAFKGQFKSLDPSAPVFIGNYDSIRLALLRAIPNRIKAHLKGSHKATHVFRHLRASWLKANNWQEADISQFFQHQSVSATAEYIHESLVDEFQSNLK